MYVASYNTVISFLSGRAEHWKIFGDRGMHRSGRNMCAQTCPFMAILCTRLEGPARASDAMSRCWVKSQRGGNENNVENHLQVEEKTIDTLFFISQFLLFWTLSLYAAGWSNIRKPWVLHYLLLCSGAFSWSPFCLPPWGSLFSEANEKEERSSSSQTQGKEGGLIAFSLLLEDNFFPF